MDSEDKEIEDLEQLVNDKLRKGEEIKEGKIKE